MRSAIRQVIRCLVTLLGTMVYLFLSFESLFGQFPERLHRRLRWAQRWFRFLLRVWGVRVIWHGTSPEREEGGILIANHRSYLDVVILFSRFPLIFVAKQEIKNWPVVGLLARYAGTIFIDRENPGTIRKQIRIIQKRIDQQFWLCFFPEGQIVTGPKLGPFRRGLLGFATMVRRPMWPVVLFYPDDKLEWGTDESLPSHLWKLWGRSDSVVHVQWLPKYHNHGSKVALDESIKNLQEEMERHYQNLRLDVSTTKETSG